MTGDRAAAGVHRRAGRRPAWGRHRTGRWPEDRNEGGAEQMSRARKAVGRITFVGAGPGDPGLLTVRAVEVLRSAEVIVVDPEVPDVLLHGGAAKVAAGSDVHPAVGGPADVAKVLVAEARAGRNVGRLG